MLPSARLKSRPWSSGSFRRGSLVLALVLASFASLSVNERSSDAAASWTVTTIASLGDAPLGSSADGSLLYVALRDARSVAVVDTADDSKEVFASGFAANPRHIAVAQSGSDALGMVVGCCDGQVDSSQRFLRSGGGDPALTNGPITGNFQGVAMMGEYALVVEDDSTATADKLRIIDARANTLKATLDLRETGGGDTCTTQCTARQIEVVGSTAYVALVGVDRIAVIDVTNPTAPNQLASISAGNGPRDVYARDGRLFVPNQIGDDVWIYDLADLTAVPTKIDVGDTPVAVAADAKYAYVVNQGSDSVSAINLSDGTVEGTLTVGAKPVFITEVSGSFYVSNIDGDSLSKITRTTLSSDASLSGLSVSEGSLSPVFASGTTSYAVEVGNGVSSVSFTPTVTDAGASVTVDGVAVGSGVASGAVALAVGANTVDVVVTAEDGSTQTYTVTVTRAAAPSPAPSSAADLGTALCFGGGATVSLTAGIPDPTGTVTLAAACSAVLDLNGQTVTVRDVVLGAGADLTIRDSAGGGALVADASGANNVAGIQTAGATLRIESGTVTATGGRTGSGASGAGIGGVYDGSGDDEHGGTVIISGGTVTATGDSFAAGIGGSQDGDGGTVTISGGTVTATGGSGAAGAGIGGGYNGDGGDVTITGGTLTATAGTVSSGPAAEPIGHGAGTTSSSGSLTLGPRAVDGTVGLVRTISFLPAAAPPAPSQLAVTCAPVPMLVGSRVSCAVTDGDPGIDILWRAAYNPAFAEAGVTLDETGTGEFSFVVPAAALGREVTVELVDWLAPVSLGVVGGQVPTSVPSGGGPVTVWSLVMLAVAGGLALRRMATVSVRG